MYILPNVDDLVYIYIYIHITECRRSCFSKINACRFQLSKAGFVLYEANTCRCLDRYVFSADAIQLRKYRYEFQR